MRAKVNRLAIASLAMSLFGLVVEVALLSCAFLGFPFSLAGLLLGIAAIRRSQVRGGFRTAMCGLVLGGLPVAPMLANFVLFQLSPGSGEITVD